MLNIGKQRHMAYLFVAPIVLFVVVYMIYPLFFNIYNSFFEWNGLDPDRLLVGLRNYTDFFTSPIFLTIMKNFVLFSVTTVFLQAFFGLLLANAMQRYFVGRDTCKAVIFMPAVLSAVVIGNVFFRILEPNVGFLNTFLRAIGLDALALQWLGTMEYSIWIIIFIQIWQWTGYSLTMYYAGLKTIPPELYESAMIDGAGSTQIFVRITVPMLRSTTFGLTILGVIGCIKQFDLVWTLTKGGPANATQFFSTYMYQVSFEQYKQGYSSAIACVMFVMCLIITVIQLRMYNQNQIQN